VGAEIESAEVEMAIEDEVVALLHSPAVQKIRFFAEGVHISGHVYMALATKVAAGRLHIAIDPTLLTQSYDGTYDAPSNTLTLPRNHIATPYNKQVALHELTHAAIDIMNLRASRGFHETENEGVSYIAEHLYVRYTHGNHVSRTDHRFVRVADAIAKTIIAARPHTYSVTHDEMRKLRNAVGQNREYRPIRGTRAISDGIP